MGKRKLYHGAGFGCILCFIYIVTKQVLSNLLPDYTAFGISRLILQVSIYFAGFYGMKRIYGIHLGFSVRNLKTGIFRYGAMVFLVILINWAGTYTAPKISLTAALPRLIFTFAGMLGIGMAEEMIFRGILFHAFRAYFGDTKKGVFTALFISSGLFGLVHLVNLFSYPNLVISTVSQVIYATFYGFLMGIVYFRSENIGSVIILHCLADFSSAFWRCFTHAGMGATVYEGSPDISIIEGIVCVLAMSPLLIAALIQLRNVFRNKEEHRVPKAEE